MKLSDMNWRDVEAAVARDPRCILPVGSTEQHAQLSLSVDSILAERVSQEAAEPLSIPVYPVVSYGLAPYFTAFPGTVSLRVETMIALIRDIVASMRRSGFKQILIVNAHGGNNPIGALAQELMADFGDVSIRFHNWWNAPRTWAKVQELDPTGSHANWMENYPWTRLPHAPAPSDSKALFDFAMMRASPPEELRTLIGDGAFGGPYQRSDEDMLALWKIGVEEVREALSGPWPELSAKDA
ncbi:creatininase family protein [Labrenzia sp. CE80]|uniref:creatininase family protein n=1 Tax=Labrenzia sp. CE80 TaxID=1788986 RepID=UPI00129BDC24|nr:creatininase family protein [Labrenzia sp. CE80]